MTRQLAALLVAGCFSIPSFAADAASSAVLRVALQAQGGEAKLRALKSVSFEAAGYRNLLEQSERPEGPYLVEFDQVSELHDHAHRALRRHVKGRVPPTQDFESTSVFANGVPMSVRGQMQVPGSGVDAKIAGERLALSPERVLITALDAPDAHLAHDVTLHGVPHAVVEFKVDGAPARLYISRWSHLPAALEYAGPLARTGMSIFLGDVAWRTAWSFWRLDKSGLRYPMQWDVQVNGMPDGTLMLGSLKVDADHDAALTTVPEAVAAKYDPKAPARDPALAPLGKPAEIAPGVVQIEGMWNTALVDQGDGIVVIEAPISSGYSAKVLDEAARRYPGKRIKAVVTTSDSWPHLAGIREYAARGIPIYALELNAPILRRWLAAPTTQRPDALQAHPRKADLRLVAGKTVIGSGPNRIELYPLQGATSERQLMAYFPEHKLLYGSDPFQKTPAGYFVPQTVTELVQAVEREHLQVDRFFMMHMPVTPYAELAQVQGSAD
jgi:hypothetical protein